MLVKSIYEIQGSHLLHIEGCWTLEAPEHEQQFVVGHLHARENGAFVNRSVEHVLPVDPIVADFFIIRPGRAEP